MNSLALWFAAYFLQSLWLVPMVLLAAWVASRVIGRVGPAALHRVWVGSLFGMVVAPALPSLHGVFSRPAVSDGAGARMTEVSLLMLGTAQGGVGDLQIALTGRVLRVICVVYALVLLWSVLRLGRSLVRTTRLRRTAVPCELPQAVAELWEEFRRWSGVDAAVCTSGAVSGPVMLGHRRPVLLLPTGFLEVVGEEDLRAALAHEAAHILRRDYLKNLVYEVVSLPITFHPATWLAKSRLAQTREMVCDAEAVRVSALGRGYLQALLRLALLVGQSAREVTTNAIGIFDANSLEERVMELNKGKRSMAAGLRYGLTVVGVGCVLLGIGAGAAAPRVSGGIDQEAAADSKVYVVGKDATAPSLLKSADPQFPVSYRKSKEGFDGTCRIKLVVDSQGVPRDVQVAKSLGKDFDESAMRAVQQYRFRPGMHSGKPVPVALVVEVRFQQF